MAETTWLEGLLAELNVPIYNPITLLSDNKSTIQLKATPILYERTKHIENDCHFIREKIKNGLVQIMCVPT